MPIFDAMVSFLSSPMGILFYYLVLLLTLEAAIGLCWGEWRRSRNARYRHFALGFGGILLGKLLVAAGEGLSLLGWLPAPVFLALFPPLSALVETVAILFLCWAFLPSEFKVRRARVALLGGSLVVTGGLYVATAILWAVAVHGGPVSPFARHILGQAWFGWQSLLFGAMFGAYVWQAGRRRALIATGFIVLALGRVLELLAFYPPSAHLTAPTLWEHLSNVIALPLFMAAIYQVVVARLYRYNRELQGLSEESQRQVRELFFLLETLKATTVSLDAQMTYNQVAENIALALRADHCALALPVPNDPQHLRVVAAYNVQTHERLAKSWLVDLTQQKVLEVAVKRNRQVMVEQIETEPALKEFYLHLSGASAGPALFQPIGTGNRVQGVLLLSNGDSGRLFTAEERAFCKNLTKQIAVALENVQIYAASKRQVQQANDLREMTRVLGASLDLKQTLDAILVQAQHKIGYDVGEITLLDADGRVSGVRGARERVYSRAATADARPSGPAAWIMEHRQPLWISQVTEQPPPRPEWTGVTVASFLGAPLQRGETLLGIIELARSRPEPFTEDHLQFLLHLADMAAEALERALTLQTLEQQLHRSQNELQAIYAAYAALQSPASLEAILGTILEQSVKATRSAGGTLVVFSEREEEGLAYQLFRGLPAARENLWRRLGVAGSALSRAARRREPLLIPDVTAVPEFRSLAENGRAQLVAPLLAAPGGGLILESPQADAYSPADLQLAQTLANAATLAVNQSRLQQVVETLDVRVDERVEGRLWELSQANQELQRQQAQMRHTVAIVRELNSSLDLTSSLPRALPLVLDTVSPAVSGATILLYDTSMSTLVPQVTVGYRARPFKLDEGLAWQAMTQRRNVQSSEPDGSAVALPLLAGEEFLGVLLLAAPGRRHFDEEELGHLSAVARDFARAISNARLYQGLGHQVESLVEMLQTRERDPGPLQPILASMPVGVLIADPDGVITLHNPLAAQLLEQEEPLVGQNIHITVGELTSEGSAAAPLLDFNPLQKRLDLERHTVEVYLSPTLAADGALLGYLALVRDISDQARRTTLRGEFLATLSHQLYGPLTAISGYLDLVLEGDAGPLTASAREYLRVAQDNCARLTHLLNNLMDLTNLERGMLPVETAPVDVGAVIAQVVAEQQDALAAHQLRLQVHIPADLPPAQANAQRLAQIVRTLLTNAIEYNEPGGQVEISAQAHDGFVQVDVADTGMGIAPGDQNQVFTQFFRSVEAQRRRVGGAGLSLALSKTLVELQGGQIWVQSDGQPGHGSTFRFTLPEARVPAVAPAVQSDLGAACPPRHILVVDDEPDILRLVAHYLQQDGYQVDLAPDGPTALDKARRRRPDLLLLDLSMPDMDGHMVIQRLRVDPATATIPVVVMSVLPADTSQARLGAVGYVSKPLHRQRLLETVHAALTRVEQILVISQDDQLVGSLTELLVARGYRLVAARSPRQARSSADLGAVQLTLVDRRAAGDPEGNALGDWLNHCATASPTVVLLDPADRSEEEHLLVQGVTAVIVHPGQPAELAERLANMAAVSSYYRDLVRATGDDDPYLRWRATEALNQAPVNEVLGYLLTALHDENPYVRLNIVDVLGRIGDDRAILALIGRLADPDPRISSRVAEVLGKLGNPRAVEPLLAHLSSPEPLVRSKVVEALGLLGDQRAVPSLLGTLADGDTRVRWSAVHALGQLGSNDVVEALIRALRDDDGGVRSRAAVALGLVAGRQGATAPKGTDRAIEALIAALEDRDPNVRERAVEALGAIGDERAIFPLRRQVTEPGHAASAALPELARLAIRQIRERSRMKGRQWGQPAEEQKTPAAAIET